MSRFSQAISEGDGISVVPVLAGDVAMLAADAAAAGAEAVAVRSVAEADSVRGAAALPVLVREPVRDLESLHGLHAIAADAFVISYDDIAGDGERLEDLHAEALELELGCALAVADEEELQRALERVDPDIFLISLRAEEGEEELERALDLLPDIPAGKLVVIETDAIEREQVLALERAGVDALVVRNLSRTEDFAGAVEALVGGTRPGS